MSQEHETFFDDEPKRSPGEDYAAKGGHGERHKLSQVARRRDQLPPQAAWETRKYQTKQNHKGTR